MNVTTSIDRRARRAMYATGVAIAVTTFTLGVAIISDAEDLTGQADVRSTATTLSLTVLCGSAYLLIGLQLMHALARLGHLRRLRATPGVPEPTRLPRVTIVVPSYNELPDLVRRALLSAALQDYPSRDVVLLLDDEPDHASAASVRAVVTELAGSFASARGIAQGAREAFEQRHVRSEHTVTETEHLAATIDAVADWLQRLADVERTRSGGHVAAWFAARVLVAPAAQLRAEARALWSGASLTEEQVRSRYRALEQWLAPSFAVFQRKRYANVPHVRSKAANLNVYLSLCGRRYEERDHAGVRILTDAATSTVGTFELPACEFVMNLDADSFVEAAYLSRMISVMTTPGNERLAIAQAPYRAIPGARRRLQQLAGATTDVQHGLHCGMAHHGAGSWVGANAVLRIAALEEVANCRPAPHDGFRRFVSDSTVIEDSETTIELIRRGWRVHNDLALTAYSETPGDFGALIVQRCRWANGGLLIAPRLLRHAARRPRRFTESTLRASYILAPAITSFATSLLVVVFVAAYPFATDVRSPWLALAATPMVALYASDLHRYGYRRSDLFGVYALNLALVPVNMAGTIASLVQAATGRRQAFGRTPKMPHRTAVPLSYSAAELTMLAVLCAGVVVHASAGHRLYASFLAVNAAACLFALVQLIGVRAMLHDLVAGAPRVRGTAAAPADPPSRGIVVAS